MPKRSLPGYDIRKKLGGGPMNHVCLARNRQTGLSCVIKFLRSRCQNDPVARKLIEGEATAGQTVIHPHLVRFLDVRLHQNPSFIVMERLVGETLRDRLKRFGLLPFRESIRILRQTTEGLAALHRGGFVHADLKPDNIHIGDDGFVKLIDLGFAHRPGRISTILADGFVLGTANYIAPELCSGQSEDDYATDLFSLGITLFEMLTGKFPYPSATPMETMRSHRDDVPAELSDYPGEWPTRLLELSTRLLAHDPWSRPSAESVVRELVNLELRLRQKRAG